MWFEHVKAPAKFPEEQMLKLTERLHEMLRTNASFDMISSSFRDDRLPRVVFLSIGDDLWPARTYYGTGFSFLDALSKAVEILRVNEVAKRDEIVKQATSIIQDAQMEHKKTPQDWIERKKDPGKWLWLKLQLVQSTRTYPTFTFNRSRFSMTDIVGFTFGPDLGFAFTPDQITGRYLLTEKGFLSKKQVGNIFAEAYNFEALSTWMKITNYNEPQGICLFEMDTYYTNGIKSCRLFRGHTLPEIPDAARCLDAARSGARAIAERIASKSGELKQPFPDWKQPFLNNEAQDDMAELSIALQRVAKATGDTSLLDVAARVLWPLQKATITFGEMNQHQAFANLEQLPPESPKQPRTFASLRNNSLALMASLPLLKDTKNEAKQAALLKKVAQFIADMKDEDGNFHNARVIPSAKLLDYHKDDLEARLSDNALAAIALHDAAVKFGNKSWQELSTATVRVIVRTLSESKDNNMTIDPWVIEALTIGKLTSQAHKKLMPRLATMMMNSRLSKPYAADLAGSPASFPSFEAAARTAWAVSALAQWFHELSPSYEEALAADNAVPTSFHLQARIDMPTASSLARPRFYLDFFRDYLDDFSFSLAGNNAQLLALTKTAELLNAFHGGKFPDIQNANQQLAMARKFLNVHPSFVNVDIITNSNEVSEEARSIMGSMSGRKESKVSPEESGLYPKRQDTRRRK
ncbi:MAG: hypothetical protein J6X55_02920 [Victivallales bacterium]|nr:hypothetical protein [Victivallales bacterium]